MERKWVAFTSIRICFEYKCEFEYPFGKQVWFRIQEQFGFNSYTSPNSHTWLFQRIHKTIQIQCSNTIVDQFFTRHMYSKPSLCESESIRIQGSHSNTKLCSNTNVHLKPFKYNCIRIYTSFEYFYLFNLVTF